MYIYEFLKEIIYTIIKHITPKIENIFTYKYFIKM